MTVPVSISMTIVEMSRPRLVTIRIVVFDRLTHGLGETRGFLLDIGPDVFLVVDKRHRFRLATGKVYEKDHDGVDQNGFDDHGIPQPVEEVFYFEGSFKW